MRKFLKNDVVQRIARTFIQGFLANLVVTVNSTSGFDEKLLKSALIGAVAGGFCAVMNLFINYLDKDKEEW